VNTAKATPPITIKDPKTINTTAQAANPPPLFGAAVGTIENCTDYDENPFEAVRLKKDD